MLNNNIRRSIEEKKRKSVKKPRGVKRKIDGSQICK